MKRPALIFLAVVCVWLPRFAGAQGLTGALIGTVKDAQGGVLPRAVVTMSSAALIGGPARTTTNGKGQLRFPVLPPGAYVLDIELPGFTTFHEAGIRIGAGATIERTVVLKLAGLAESIVVEGTGSRIEARDLRVASDASTCCWTSSMRSMTRRRKLWPPTTCSARTSASRHRSLIRAARCSVSGSTSGGRGEARQTV